MPGHGVAALVQNLYSFAIVPVVQHRFDNICVIARWYRVKKIAHDHVAMALATPNIDESVESAKGIPLQQLWGLPTRRCRP